MNISYAWQNAANTQKKGNELECTASISEVASTRQHGILSSVLAAANLICYKPTF